jgi:hypothetical protein
LQEEAGHYRGDPAARYEGKWPGVLEILRECPSAEEITEMLTDVGFRMEDFNAQYGVEKIRDGLRYGKDLKDRYSVLWIYAFLQNVGEVWG